MCFFLSVIPFAYEIFLLLGCQISPPKLILANPGKGLVAVVELLFMGAGTDPTEGAALAIAILDDLHTGKIRTVATTHYAELKMYAMDTPGVENACCEFDVETLSPTYRLLVGVPGKSNAFAISSKLGLPDYIINKAKDEISEQDESFEDVLTTLEQNRITLEREKEASDDPHVQS